MGAYVAGARRRIDFAKVDKHGLIIWFTFLQSSSGSLHSTVKSGQMRSVVWTYDEATRRRVHSATVLLRPPSGHRPGRRQARYTSILQIRRHHKQSRSTWTATRHDLFSLITTREILLDKIPNRESRHSWRRSCCSQPMQLTSRTPSSLGTTRSLDI